jgi:hypothetical protein
LYHEIVYRFTHVMRDSRVYVEHSDLPGDNAWKQCREQAEETLKAMFAASGVDISPPVYNSVDASWSLPAAYVSCHAQRWMMQGAGEKRYVVCPLRHHLHYVLFVLDTKTRVAVYVNSLGGYAGDAYCLAAVGAFERAFQRSWTVKHCATPRQTAMECAVCVCLFMHIIAIDDDGVAALADLKRCLYGDFLAAELRPRVLALVAEREAAVRARDAAVRRSAGQANHTTASLVRV